MLNTTGLAKELGVSKARISQYVSDGKLKGCFTGSGRARRFDLAQVCRALNKTLDRGQMMGNGAQTRRALADLQSTDDPDDADDLPPETVALGLGSRSARDGLLPVSDGARYEMARTLKAEEEARALRRRNAEAEGLYVLASEVQREVTRVVAQEVAEFESVLREAARAVADRLGVDFRTARQIMIESWRDHRAERHGVLIEVAEAAIASDAEKAADI